MEAHRLDDASPREQVVYKLGSEPTGIHYWSLWFRGPVWCLRVLGKATRYPFKTISQALEQYISTTNKP